MNVIDYDLHRPLRWSCYHQRQIVLCCRDLSLERLTGSDRFFNIFDAVQEDPEDETVYTINDQPINN